MGKPSGCRRWMARYRFWPPVFCARMIGRVLRARDPDARHVRRDRFGHLQRRCPARRPTLASWCAPRVRLSTRWRRSQARIFPPPSSRSPLIAPADPAAATTIRATDLPRIMVYPSGSSIVSLLVHKPGFCEKPGLSSRRMRSDRQLASPKGIPLVSTKKNSPLFCIGLKHVSGTRRNVLQNPVRLSVCELERLPMGDKGAMAWKNRADNNYQPNHRCPCTLIRSHQLCHLST